METTVTDAGPFEKRIVLAVPEDRLEPAKAAAARKLSRSMRIPGFRPGRAPRKVVETTVGADRLRAEAIDDALSEIVGEALDGLDFELAATPSVERVDDTDTGIEISVVVAMWPTLDAVPNYVGREISVASPLVTDDELAEQVDRMREQFAELNEVDRAVAEKDYVVVDLSAVDAAGDKLDALDAQDLTLSVGSSFIEGLDDAVTGMSAGDSASFASVLPEGFGDLADAEATITVVVKTVQERILPDLTDEWVDETTEFETVEALHGELRGRMAEGKFGQSWEAYRAALVNELVEEIDIEIPDGIVSAEMENVLHRFNHSLSEQNIEFDDYLQVSGQTQESFVADLRLAAASNVRTDLLLDAIADDAGIEPDDDEVEAMYAAVAASTGETAAQVSGRLTVAQNKSLMSDILRRKAHDELLKAAVPVDDNGNPIDFEVLAAELQASRATEEEE